MSRKIEDINPETIIFSKQKVKSNNKFLYVYSEKKPLVLKMPKTRIPFGLQKDTLSNKNQYILDISLEKQSSALEAFQNLNKNLIKKVHEEFFPEKTIEEVKETFVDYIKYPENPMFAPVLRTKIIVGEDMKPKCDFYNHEKNEEGKYPKIDVVERGNESYLLKTIGKSSYIETIIECIGLWFFNGKFGVSFKAIQVMIHPQVVEEKVKECQFIDSDSETSNSDADFLD
jgi:hypothetical protein